MSRLTVLTVILVAAILPATAWGQLPDKIVINKPECGNWDSLYNRYLISMNIDNDIVAVDQNGVVTMFKENCGTYITSAGISGTTFYQTDVTKVTGYDLATAAQVFFVEIPEARYLGGSTADSSGNIYVPDEGGGGVGRSVIWKIRLSDGAYSVFADTDHGLGFRPRDIVFDPVQNRLVVTFMQEPVYIQAISVADSVVTNLVRFETDYTNGIARDQFGWIYVAGYDTDTIYRYPPDFSELPEVVSYDHEGPCNIDYNPQDHIIVVPNYFSDTVEFVRVGRPKLKTWEFSDAAGGDGDGEFDPGETIDLAVTFACPHLMPLSDLSINLFAVTDGIAVAQGTADIGGAPARSEVNNSATPLSFVVAAEYVAQVDSFYLEFTYTSDYGSEVDTVVFPAFHDIDLDLIPDAEDNCLTVSNYDQIDTDEDGIGDVCDDCTDTDGDYFGDPGYPTNTCPLDNCPSVPNPYDPDSDGDGYGDACDVCPGFDDDLDSDSDGWADGCDNCPDDPNPGQEDVNGNGIGDICDGCCADRVGDANGLGGDEPTIGDVSTMIDALFIGGDPVVIACLTEADVNQSGGTDPQPDDITIGDISTLIDYLFITGSSLGLPDCL